MIMHIDSNWTYSIMFAMSSMHIIMFNAIYKAVVFSEAIALHVLKHFNVLQFFLLKLFRQNVRLNKGFPYILTLTQHLF